MITDGSPKNVDNVDMSTVPCLARHIGGGCFLPFTLKRRWWPTFVHRLTVDMSTNVHAVGGWAR